MQTRTGEVCTSPADGEIYTDNNFRVLVDLTDRACIATFNADFIPYTYDAIWERYKAAKTMEDAEPWVELLRGLDAFIGRSTSGGGKYQPCATRCFEFECNKCDPDTCQELHRERIQAEDSEKVFTWHDRVKQQGILSIRLNGSDLAIIDPNTREITGLPSVLSFDQFNYINKIYQAIAPNAQEG